MTSARDLGPVDLALIDPEGKRVRRPVNRLGGPPWTWWVEASNPAAGDWTAVIGDGARVDACERFRVARGPSGPPEPPEPGSPAWTPLWKWERDTENLYAAFVEQLFREPLDDDTTWPRLQILLADPSRNLLYDHLGLREDERLSLEPDCADLPYFLRAYFAWKTRLPFSFRRCNRGAPGSPPSCSEEPLSNLDPPAAGPPPDPPPAASNRPPSPPAEAPRDEVEAFEIFIERVANTVHSASGRTHPDSDFTDLYPVPLSRETLAPGTVFADPYGHLLVVAGWIPQALDRYGVLLGADAQPDGTVGRRRFWRGSFLFTPDTTDAGAGFKAWRPPAVRREGDRRTVILPTNEDLRRSPGHVQWSDEQYGLTVDEFYDRMEALINPRPLDPIDAQIALVDALEEAVARRVVSVANGEAYMAGRLEPITMPEGYNIFETIGPWEDYATPARDMRLLISIDAVVGFADGVGRMPERFGLTPERAREEATRLHERLRSELTERRFEYVRSDGSAQPLTLADVVDRAEAFETAYNPNDCVEIRWGAPPGSQEAATCTRLAPEDQRARMGEYRLWFRDRRRPPRGTP